MNQKKASIIGIGRLGLCFALTLEKAGYDVIGCDVNEDLIKSINNKKVYTIEPGVNEHLSRCRHFRATSDLAETVNHSNLIFVTVRTESTPDGSYDHSQFENVAASLSSLGRQIEIKYLVISCNVMPGYSDSVSERLSPLGYTVLFNPEWVAQGRILYDQEFPDVVVVGGPDDESIDFVCAVHEDITTNEPLYHKMDRLSAELTKASLNCFVASKIAIANLIGDLAIRVGADPDKVLAAVGDDPRVGSNSFKYGFGYGGPCFPRDLDAFITYATKNGVDPIIQKAVKDANRNHLGFQVKRFKASHPKGDGPIRMEGVAYKHGVTLLDFSQQLAFAEYLAKDGYNIIVVDHPDVIKKLKSNNRYAELFQFEESQDQ